MSLFDRYTEEGRARFSKRKYGDEKQFEKLWGSGQITFMEIMQDGNMAGSYLRYYYLYNSDYYELICDIDATDTPFKEFQKNQVQEIIYTHTSDNGQPLRYKCERKEKYVYHFTLMSA